MNSLAAQLKREARRLGFVACSIAPATEATHADFFDQWIAAGRAGEMAWLERNSDKRRFPATLDESGATPYRSLILLATPYHPYDLPPEVRDDPARGIIASYAWGEEYHDLIRRRLNLLDEFLRALSGRATQAKGVVDSAPVLERNWAQEAGVGFIGKNCCVIRPGYGSWLFLATLLVPETLDYDPPANHSLIAAPDSVLAGLPDDGVYGKWKADLVSTGDADANLRLAGGCGRCTRCLDACPTNAFVGPFHLDPQRCISYWTIEARSPIPRDLRRSFGNRIFGCDICQEVCPWNERLDTSRLVDAAFTAALERAAPPLLEGFNPAFPYWLDDAAFSRRFRNSPIKRAKRAGMVRNVCVALGNWGDAQVIPALLLALHDASPLARGHAAWALGEVMRKGSGDGIREALAAALAGEEDAFVCEEIAAAAYPLS